MFNLFGNKSEKIREKLEAGALIIDVRTPAEFNRGHIPKSRNIPLDKFEKHIPELKKKGREVILCCATGMRSGMATSILSREGVTAMNAGGWQKLLRTMQKVQ